MLARSAPVALPAALLLSLALATSACEGQGGAEDSAYDPYLKVGASARDFLSSERFRGLTVEVRASQGLEPSNATLSRLQEFLEQRLDKPDGIRILKAPPLAPAAAGARYATEDVRALDRAHRTQFSKGAQLSVFVLFLGGKSAQDDGNYNTLGQTYWNTSMVVYGNTTRRVAENLGGSPQAVHAVESVTLLHEFGHALGLVANGTPQAPIGSAPAGHLDEAHPAHCNNPRCLMHYSVENGLLAQVLMTGQFPELDAPCLNDLRANGGR